MAVQTQSLNLQQPGTMGSGWRGQAGANFMAQHGAGMMAPMAQSMMGMGIPIPGVGPVAGMAGLLGQFDPAEIKQAVQELTAELPQQGPLGAPLGAAPPPQQQAPLIGQDLAAMPPAGPPSGLRGPFAPNTEPGPMASPETAMTQQPSHMIGDVPVPTPSPFKTAQGADLWNVSPGANMAGVDQRLQDAMKYGAWNSGTMIDAFSGVKGRNTGTTNHPTGRAVDVRIIDQATGRALPNYQNAETFRDYEKYAQEVRKSQMLQSPELNDNLRWGGYFAGGPNPRDSMHFDISGRPGLGMAGGSWAGGATPQQLAALGRGASSVGMGNYSPPMQSGPPEPIQQAALTSPQQSAVLDTAPSLWETGKDFLTRAKAELGAIRSGVKTAKSDIKKFASDKWSPLAGSGAFPIGYEGPKPSVKKELPYAGGQLVPMGWRGNPESEGMVNNVVPGQPFPVGRPDLNPDPHKPGKPSKPHRKPFRYDPYSIAWQFPQYTQTWAFTPPRVPGYMG